MHDDEPEKLTTSGGPFAGGFSDDELWEWCYRVADNAMALPSADQRELLCELACFWIWRWMWDDHEWGEDTLDSQLDALSRPAAKH